LTEFRVYTLVAKGSNSDSLMKGQQTQFYYSHLLGEESPFIDYDERIDSTAKRNFLLGCEML